MAHIARSAAGVPAAEPIHARRKEPLVQVQTTGTTHRNPSPDELRAFTEEMPQCRITEFDNVNVQTRVVSRSSGSTFIVTDDPSTASGKTMSREEYDRVAKMQDEYIAQQDMLVIDGYIGNDPG